MNEIINTINAWIPTIASIIAVVATAISAHGNLKTTIRSAHSTLESMKSDRAFKECAEDLRKLSAENRELNRRIAILTDRIAKIEGYSDMVGGE